MLITPKPGYAVISADITGAEDWLAAGYSGDPKLMEIYSSGKDSYVEFAAITGAVPPGPFATSPTSELEQIQRAAQNREAGDPVRRQETTLSKQLAVPPWKAARILNAHRAAYDVYWQWVADRARSRRESRIRRHRLRLAPVHPEYE